MKIAINKKWLYGFLITFFLCALYAGVVSFRTMPISEGWYSEYAWLINHGSLPYRDFEYLFFPLYMFIIAAFSSIFGYSIFALRILGIFVFGGIGVALYCMYSKIFRKSVGMIAAVVTALYIQSEVGQIFYDYIRFHDLFAVITAYFLLRFSLDIYKDTDYIAHGTVFTVEKFTKYFVPGIYALIGIAGIIFYPIASFPLKGGFLVAVALGSILLLIFNILRSREATRKPNHIAHTMSWSAVLCGIFSAAECMVKQSNGALMIAMIVVFVSFCTIVLKKSKFLGALVGYLAGLAFAFSFLIIYLLVTNTAGDFFQCCFGNAIAAKGGIIATLFNWIIPNLQLALTSTFIIVFVLAVYVALIIKQRKDSNGSNIWKTIIWVIGTVILVSIILLFTCNESLAISFYTQFNTSTIPFAVFFVCAFFFILYAVMLIVNRVRGKAPDCNIAKFFPLFPILGCIFAQGYGSGMSGGLGVSQVAIGLGLIIGFCLNSALLGKKKVFFVGASLYIAVLTCTFISCKTVQTYYWWGLTQDKLSEHTELTNVPLLDGIYVRPVDKMCYDTVYNDIISNTEVGDNIFTFPHCPIFYTLTDRHSITYSKVQWFDVSSVNAIEQDILLLKQDPPKMIVYVTLPDSVYDSHENLFSTYQTREMRNFILDELVPQNGYSLLNQVDIGNGYFVNTYLLP